MLKSHWFVVVLILIATNMNHLLWKHRTHGPTERTEVIFAWFPFHSDPWYAPPAPLPDSTTERLLCRGRCPDSKAYKVETLSQQCNTTSLRVQRSSLSPEGRSLPSTGRRDPPRDCVRSSSGCRCTGGRVLCPHLRNRHALVVTHPWCCHRYPWTRHLCK